MDFSKPYPEGDLYDYFVELFRRQELLDKLQDLKYTSSLEEENRPGDGFPQFNP